MPDWFFESGEVSWADPTEGVEVVDLYFLKWSVTPSPSQKFPRIILMSTAWKCCYLGGGPILAPVLEICDGPLAPSGSVGGTLTKEEDRVVGAVAHGVAAFVAFLACTPPENKTRVFFGGCSYLGFFFEIGPGPKETSFFRFSKKAKIAPCVCNLVCSHLPCFFCTLQKSENF